MKKRREIIHNFKNIDNLFFTNTKLFDTKRNICKLIGITYEGYLKWTKREKPEYKPKFSLENLELVRRTFIENKEVYGAPRIAIKLKDFNISKTTVSRYLKILAFKSSTRSKSTNWRQYKQRSLLPVKYKNVLNRNFNPKKPNKFWSIDIKEISNISDNRIYICSIIDLLFNREVIGYSVATNQEISMVLIALRKTYEYRHLTKRKKIIYSLKSWILISFKRIYKFYKGSKI